MQRYNNKNTGMKKYDCGTSSLKKNRVPARWIYKHFHSDSKIKKNISTVLTGLPKVNYHFAFKIQNKYFAKNVN